MAQTIALRVAVTAEDAKRILTELKQEGSAAFDQIGAAAKRAGANANEATGSLGGMSRQATQNFTNASQQIQDVVGQISAGTDIIPTLAQQIPQAVGGFGAMGAAAGAAFAVLAGGVLAIRAFTDNAESAAAAARDQADALDELRERFGIVNDSAAELTASYENMSEGQRAIVQNQLQATLDAQTKAMKQQVEEVMSAFTAARGGIAFSTLDAGTEGDITANPLTEQQRVFDEALGNMQQRLREAFQAGDIAGIEAAIGALAQFNLQLKDAAQNTGFESMAAELQARLREIVPNLDEVAQKTEQVKLENQAAAGVDLSPLQQQWFDYQQNIGEASAATTQFRQKLEELRGVATGTFTEIDRKIASNVRAAGVQNLPIFEQPFAEDAIAQATIDAEAAEERRRRDEAAAKRRETQRQQATNALQKLRDDAAAARLGEADIAGVNAAQQLGTAATQKEIDEAKRLGVELHNLKEARQEEAEAARERERAREFAAGIQAEADQARRLAESLRGGIDAYEATQEAIAAENQVRRQKEGLTEKERADLVATIQLTNEQEKATKANAAAMEQLAEMQQQGALRASVNAIVGGGAGPRQLFAGLDLPDRQRQDNELVTRIAVEGAEARAKALGEEATSLRLVRENAEFLAGYAEKLEDVSDPQLVENTLRLAMAQREQANADDRAERLREDRQSTLGVIADEMQLSGALNQSVAAYNRLVTILRVRNELLQRGHNLNTAEGQRALQEALHAEELAQANEDRAAAMEQAQHHHTQNNNQPLRDIGTEMAGTFTSIFSTIREEGHITAEDLGQAFTDAFGNIADSVVNQLISAPINAAIGQLQTQIANSMAQGGSGNPLAAVLGMRGFGAGMIGFGVGGAVANTYTGLTGGNQQGSAYGSAIGGLLGGLGGSLFGMPLVGAALGSAAGGIFGGLFGGGEGENNDAMGFSYDPRTGRTRRTDKSGSSQNAQRARALLDEAIEVNRFLQTQGFDYRGTGSQREFQFKVGNKSGIEFEGEEFDTAQDAMQAAIRQIIENSVGEASEITRTVLENTKARSLAELRSDIEFARNYERLTDQIGDFGIELLELRDAFNEARATAEELGLSTEELARAQTEAERDLLEERRGALEDQLKSQAQGIRDFFENINQPYRQALGAFGVGQGNAAPQATLRGGLAEFREMLGAAAANDNNALANLPGLAAQVIQAARAFGGSGAEAQAVIAEVTRGLRETLAANEARANEVLASIPDTLRITADDQIRNMKEQFEKTREVLERLNADVRKLKVA